MRISKITGIDYKNINSNKSNYNLLPKTSPLQADSVAFKGVGLGLTMLVAKEGYKALTSTRAKANFANELSASFSNPDTANQARQIVSTLFALAKSPAKNEPDGLVYYAFRTDGVQSPSLGYMRSQALKKLFPLVPELANDINSGHAAKMALLNSLVDTGEYLDSDTFCDAFSSLPSIYNGEKTALIMKLMKDNNVHNETYMKKLKERAFEAALEHDVPGGEYPLIAFPAFCIGLMMLPHWKAKYIKENYLKLMPEADKRAKVANVALLSTMNPQEFPDLFQDYGATIQSEASVAFKYIKDVLQNDNGVPEKDQFYEYYTTGFESCFLEEPLNDYERRLARQYFLEFMAELNGNKDAIMKEFNISESFCNDLIKDYELVVSTKDINDVEKLKQLYENRIAEKKSDSGAYIHDSARGLLYISGREDELGEMLKENDEI